jgi:hypothetical protein
LNSFGLTSVSTCTFCHRATAADGAAGASGGGATLAATTAASVERS